MRENSAMTGVGVVCGASVNLNLRLGMFDSELL